MNRFLGKQDWNKDETFFFFLPHSKAYGILFPPPGIEPMLPAVEVQNLNHWTPREVLRPTYRQKLFELIMWWWFSHLVVSDS